MAKLVVADQYGRVRNDGDLAELLNAAETGGIGNAEEILKDDEDFDANQEEWINARKEMYRVLVRHTNSEATARLRANYSRKHWE